MTKSEKRHMDRVGRLPCGVCGIEGVELHHIREGQGMAQRASNFLVIPLCPGCHRGPNGLHGDRAMFKIHKVDELDVLAHTIEVLYA
jgi:hypothetical protein